MRLSLPHVLIAFLGVCTPHLSRAAGVVRVEIAAPECDRAAQIVEFSLPEKLREATALVLRDALGGELAVQCETPISSGLRAFVVVPMQHAGELLAFEIVSEARTSPDSQHGVVVVQTDAALDLTIAGRSALSYRISDELPPGIDRIMARGGVLHPVLTPGGVCVTDYAPGIHPQHKGIWSSWVSTGFRGHEVDFWNMLKKQGRSDFVAVDRVWSGPACGGFEARHAYRDITSESPVTVLHERWRLQTYDLREIRAHVFDLEITQSCATADPLVLKEYHYGGLGFRAHAQWLPKENIHFLTSTGEINREAANSTRARWCHIGGAVDGALAGIALLDHPANFRAPQPLRVHPSMPFVCFAPSLLGGFAIEPGKPYVMRYRFIVSDGPPDRALIDACWAGFGQSVTASVTE